MPKRKKLHRKHPLHRLMKGNILVILLFVIVAFGILLTSGAMVNKSAVDKTEQFGEAQVSSESGKQNLQLKTLTFKPKPTPDNKGCTADSGQIVSDDCVCPDYHIICKDKKCDSIGKGMRYPDATCDNIFSGGDGDDFCQNREDGGTCYGKPVIYLYPEKPTLVDVTVKTEGKIVVSDPFYPQGGWKQILAQPTGDLTYQGKHYRELFYETSVNTVTKPSTGIVISSKDLESKLRSLIEKLGLTKQNEQQEFLDWWIPRLTALRSPYVFVSLVGRDEKAQFDKVEITPAPDTFIDFIVYFKPLDRNETVETLILPPTPQRIGFTAIEWGGVIDKD